MKSNLINLEKNIYNKNKILSSWNTKSFNKSVNKIKDNVRSLSKATLNLEYNIKIDFYI